MNTHSPCSMFSPHTFSHLSIVLSSPLPPSFFLLLISLVLLDSTTHGWHDVLDPAFPESFIHRALNTALIIPKSPKLPASWFRTFECVPVFLVQTFLVPQGRNLAQLGLAVQSWIYHLRSHLELPRTNTGSCISSFRKDCGGHCQRKGIKCEIWVLRTSLLCSICSYATFGDAYKCFTEIQ